MESNFPCVEESEGAADEADEANKASNDFDIDDNPPESPASSSTFRSPTINSYKSRKQQSATPTSDQVMLQCSEVLSSLMEKQNAHRNRKKICSKMQTIFLVKLWRE